MSICSEYDLTLRYTAHYRNWPLYCYRWATLTINIMILLGVSIYLVITFFLTFIGIERQNEGLKIFIISMLLTPLAGLLFMASRKKNYVKVNYYHCKECKYIFPVKIQRCPICEENGKKVRLRRYVSPYNIADTIEVTDFE